MKSLLLASLLALTGGVALADTAPKAPDFTGAKPNKGVDRSLAASDGTAPIEPTEIVNFALDSTALDTAAISQLDTLAKYMKKNPKQNLVVEGHTDRSGSKDHNYDLGERRAQIVRDHLSSWGIKADRIVLATFGEREAHHAQNANDRRVVIYASDRPKAELVKQVLENTQAKAVAWTDKGTKLAVTK